MHVYKSPCLGCGDRFLLCHSKCDKYMEYRNNLNNRKELIQHANELNKAFVEMKRIKKKYNIKCQNG